MAVQSIDFSPDGKRLAIGGIEPSRSTSGVGRIGVRLWELSTGKEVLALPTGSVKSLAFSLDGKLLATASWSGQARVWDANSGKPLAEFPQNSQEERVSRVAFLGSGGELVTATNDHLIRSWDVGSGTRLRTFRGHAVPITWLATLADGKGFASSAADGSVKLWDATRDQEALALSLPGENLLGMGFEAGSGVLRVAGSNGSRTWSIGQVDWKPDSRFPRVKPPKRGMTVPIFAISSNGQPPGWHDLAGTTTRVCRDRRLRCRR